MTDAQTQTIGRLASAWDEVFPAMHGPYVRVICIGYQGDQHQCVIDPHGQIDWKS